MSSREPVPARRPIRVYPAAGPNRRRTAAADLSVLLALLVLLWMAVKVHDGVASLAQVTRSFTHTGLAVQRGFDSAANTIGGAPFVGGQLAHSLRAAGADTGGAAAAAGRGGTNDVGAAALILGLLTFFAPAALLLQRYGPVRWRQIRRLSTAAQVLEPSLGSAQRELLAQRAAFSLPYGLLLRHTRDPLGDLAAGRHDALVAALLEDAGLA